MNLKKIFFPTIPKIILYLFFFFLSPTFFKVCTSNGCNFEFKFLAGLRLAQQTSHDVLWPMFLLLLIFSYIFACLIIAGFNYLKEQKMTLE